MLVDDKNKTGLLPCSIRAAGLRTGYKAFQLQIAVSQTSLEGCDEESGTVEQLM